MNSEDIAPGIRVRYKWRTFSGIGVIKHLVPGDRVAVKCEDSSLIVVISIGDISPIVTENLPPITRKVKT